MSTRACIQIYLEKSNYKENTEGKREFVNTERKPYLLLYRHCDWYPTGLGLDLLEAVKDCAGDRELLKCLGSMEYPPEFTGWHHSDIEYFYKIYAGEMSHKHDQKAITITYKPVHMWDATDEQREELIKPHNEDETNVLDDEDVKQEIEDIRKQAEARLESLPKTEETPTPKLDPSLQKMLDDIAEIKAS